MTDYAYATWLLILLAASPHLPQAHFCPFLLQTSSNLPSLLQNTRSYRRSLLCRCAPRTFCAARSQAYGLSQPTRHRSSHSMSLSSSSPLIQRWVHTPPGLPIGPPLSFWDRIPEDTLLYGAIGLNGLVFGMWYMARWKARRTRDQSALIWMSDNFTNSWRNITSSRVWTLVTSSFSHDTLGHVLCNGWGFYSMARPVLRILGSKNFLLLYIGGGVAANVASLAWKKIKGQDYPALGASGALYSVASFLACLAPSLTFQLYGIIPVPAWAAITGTFAFDTYSAITDRRKGVDTAGHVAGIIAGVGFYMCKRYRIF